MCYLFTNVYPANALRNGRNGCSGSLCFPGGVNRCIDNENVLDGIGGLLDQASSSSRPTTM